jgi:hypothetical protein
MKRRCAGLEAVIPLALTLLATGCMLNPYIFGTYGATALSNNEFSVHIPAERQSELGGLSSPALASHVAKELAAKNLCPNGFKLLYDGLGRGYYYVRGRCN